MIKRNTHVCDKELVVRVISLGQPLLQTASVLGEDVGEGRNAKASVPACLPLVLFETDTQEIPASFRAIAVTL